MVRILDNVFIDRVVLTCLSCRHIYMVISEIVTLLIYLASMAFLPEYFGMLLS
jgi:hypothetical protein